MVSNKILSILLSIFCYANVAVAFAPTQAGKPALVAPLQATSKPMSEKFTQLVTTTAAVIATSPLAALADEVPDDYEYGAVDAPIGIAWAAGVLAVATALLPLALQGGEEAFEEMKDRDSGSWGTGATDALNKNRRR